MTGFRGFLATSLVLISTSAAAYTIRFDPPNPSSHDAVRVWTYTICPASFRAEITSPAGVICTSARSIELDRMRNLIMSAWGARARYPYVPVWAMYAAAGAFEFWAALTGTTPLATRRNIASTAWDREFSIAKARAELGYEPAMSFESGIAETVAWYKNTE